MVRRFKHITFQYIVHFGYLAAVFYHNPVLRLHSFYNNKVKIVQLFLLTTETWFTSTGRFTRQTTVSSTGACATGGYRTLTLRLEVRSKTNSVDIQSTLVISKSSGLSQISRDIRLSRYQIAVILGACLLFTSIFSKREQNK